MMTRVSHVTHTVAVVGGARGVRVVFLLCVLRLRGAAACVCDAFALRLLPHTKSNTALLLAADGNWDPSEPSDKSQLKRPGKSLSPLVRRGDTACNFLMRIFSAVVLVRRAPSRVTGETTAWRERHTHTRSMRASS